MVYLWLEGDTPTAGLSTIYVDDIFDGVSEKTVGLDDLLDKIGGLHAPSAKSSIKKKNILESTTSSKSFLDSLEQITKNGSKHTSGSSTPPHYRGLLPSQRMFQTQSTSNPNRKANGITCVQEINSANQIFNNKLKGLVKLSTNSAPRY
ncbi:hypothetical protein MTR_2g087100 [Medicago truncatula]|uniref:Uncharacterized protein n=1 Tax=Medicago truncatula TaxID=3880 RepID=G7IHI3_MEDTR|nr:hypothetical protein MTR_2g087100 [Medicago truncatula]